MMIISTLLEIYLIKSHLAVCEREDYVFEFQEIGLFVFIIRDLLLAYSFYCFLTPVKYS